MSIIRKRIHKIKLLSILLLIFFVGNAATDPITENEVEDLNLLIPQFIGGEANLLLIFDMSRSTVQNYGGTQTIGNWDRRNVTDSCRIQQAALNSGNPAEYAVGHCTENAAGLNDFLDLDSSGTIEATEKFGCGSRECTSSPFGTCENEQDFEEFLTCIENNFDSSVVTTAFNNALSVNCSGMAASPNLKDDLIAECDDTVDTNGVFVEDCDDIDTKGVCVERIAAAAAIDNVVSYLTQASGSRSCGADYCTSTITAIDPITGTSVTSLDSSGNHSCNTSTERDNLISCVANTRYIPTDNTTCPNGKFCSKGTLGSTRNDAIRAAIFDLLDADDSVAGIMCDDEGGLFTGSSANDITCAEYLATPFRDLEGIPTGTGSKSTLPVAGAGVNTLKGHLTDADGNILNIRFRSMAIGGKDYSGSNPGTLVTNTTQNAAESCFGNSFLDSPSGGFAGGSATKLGNVWDFYKSKEAGGRTSLAAALGIDDLNTSSADNLGVNDALNLYETEIKTDAACSCRQEFVIIITDGEENCVGDCATTPTSCGIRLQTGTKTVQNPITTNANRRSAIQAVSTLRTHFARKPTVCNALSADVNKEVMTFVVGYGVKDNQKARRTLNAMALMGGTTSIGILEHESPTGGINGTVRIEDFVSDPTVLPNVLEEIAKMNDFGSDPNGVWLEDCGRWDGTTMTGPSETGSCTFKGDAVFDNNFFDGSTPIDSAFDATDKGSSFAFFVEDPADLVAALEDIFNITRNFSASGSSPAAPGSTGSLAVRDRIYLSSLLPRTDQPIWQGRIAAFGFIDDPTNQGAKLVVRAPRDSQFVEFIDTGDETPDTSAILSAVIFTDIGVLNSNAQEFHWEAGKLLAERDLNDTNEPRKLITVDPSQILTDFDVTNSISSLNYKSELIAFDNSTISTGFFGISDADVTAETLALCDTTVCQTGVGQPCEMGIGDPTCKAAIKNFIKDYIVDFMSGDTSIIPSQDSYGSPSNDACPLSGDADSELIGCNCFDPESNTGGFDRCSVRLGDVFHSTPILVGSPSALFFDVGFQTFAREFIDRSAVLYVGANDGFLHAIHAGELVDTTSLPSRNPFTSELETLPFFDNQGGKEVFAFTSPSMLTDSRAPLDALALIDKDPTSPPSDFFGHPTPEYRYGDMKSLLIDELFQRSFFDSTPLLVDVWLDSDADNFNGHECARSGCDPMALAADLQSPSGPDGTIDPLGREWHTVLITGYRNGGGAYTALDVTNVDATDPTDKTIISSLPDYRKFSDGPDYPRHLWTVFDKEFGNTWSEPVLGRIRVNWKNGADDVASVQDRWVVFVSGGLDPNILNVDPTEDIDGDGLIDIVDPDNTVANSAGDEDPVNPDDPYYGNAFYAIDIASGKILYKFDPSDSSLNNSDLMVCSMASQPGSFDLNSDGFTDIVYAGDVCGRLWRFDVSQTIELDGGADLGGAGIKGNPDVVNVPWTGSIAFCADTDANCTGALGPIIPPAGSSVQPIYFAPTVALDNLGRKHVVFITGDRREPSNPDTFGKLYNFIDPFVPAFLAGGIASGDVLKTETDLTVIVSLVPDGLNEFTVDPDPGSTEGEYIVAFPNACNTTLDVDCDEGGEKGIGTPVVFANTLLFTTFTPDSGTVNVCTAGLGTGRLFGIDFITGLPALGRIPGAASLISDADTVSGAFVGEGIPSPARLTFGSTGSVIMSVAFSGSGVSGGSTFLVIELGSLPAQTQTLFWEEII